ncbi:dimethylaniline monooxygenase [Schizopora paradoxa]|uniref:Dimethylaniline monooxygenase n=1 Tax=Schizopora paradoxa TaxID=27342 RepID=A0A0H2RUT2_9AGAM|nr:dimethylaniline monooxygenase [Schizopora paradoxa]
MATANLNEVVDAWVLRANKALNSFDAEAFSGCFALDGWFRDLLTFSWDFHSLHGRDAIKSYVGDALSKVQATGLSVDKDFVPRRSNFGPRIVLIDAALTFETPRAHGKGFVRIRTDGDVPEAFAFMMMISDWKGHEEARNSVLRPSAFATRTKDWAEVVQNRRNDIEKNPDVIILGAGQTGLQVAARFSQMNIKALVLDKNERVGDNWRSRYSSLVLHTPRVHHTFLYQSYPTNWPKYTPKDKLAFWLEQYAESNDLVIWLKSTLEPSPVYDSNTQKWSVVVNRNGVHVHLQSSHIVVATSMYGEPNIPDMKGREDFQGQICHSAEFTTGSLYAGKKVVVVGAGNSGGDISLDLVEGGASQVTIVQRSASVFASDKFAGFQLDQIYPEGQKIDHVDLSVFTMPLEALRKLMRDIKEMRFAFDKELREGLDKAGFKLSDGVDNGGAALQLYDSSSGGSYFLDCGCAQHIISGRIGVKQGVGIEHLTSDKVVFTDGSELEADAIVLATGWHSIRGKLDELFGEEVMKKTTGIWGIDEGGEVRAGYRLSGHSGFWFAFGGFIHSRFYSKQLALFIKAIELGYLKI